MEKIMPPLQLPYCIEAFWIFVLQQAFAANCGRGYRDLSNSLRFQFLLSRAGPRACDRPFRDAGDEVQVAQRGGRGREELPVHKGREGKVPIEITLSSALIL